MRFLIIIAISAFLFACQSTETTSNSRPGTSGDDYLKLAEKPDIQIQVDGVNGGMGYIIGTFQGQNFRLDSAQFSPSGQIVFKRGKPYHPGFLMLVFGNNSYLQMLVDLDQTFTMHSNLNDLIGAMKVEGSHDNTALYEALRFEAGQQAQFAALSEKMKGMPLDSPDYPPLKEQQDKLVDERNAFMETLFKKYPNSLFTSFKRAGQNPDLRDIIAPGGSINPNSYLYHYRARFWDHVDFTDERLMYTPVISNKLNRYIKELTPQQPDSVLQAAYMLVDKLLDHKEYFKYIANWIVLEYDPKKSKMMDSEAIFVNMVQKYFTYERAFWSDSVEVHGLQLRAHEMSASLVGKKGPDVISTDPNGQTRSIYEIKDPYVVVYMFNPDCEHCAVQTPKLVELYKTWKPKGMEVFAIAVDTDDAKWKAYIAKNKMNFINVYDPTNRSIYAKYFVDVTPEIYVLNPDRTLIAKNLQVDQIPTVIEQDMAKRKR